MDKVDERDKSILKHKNQFTMLNSLWFAVGSLMQQVSEILIGLELYDNYDIVNYRAVM